MMAFCWLPPLRLVIMEPMPAVLMASFSTMPPASRRSCLRLSRPAQAEGRAVAGNPHSPRFPPPAEIDRLDFAPHHQMRDLPRIGFVAFHGLDQLAIAEHRDPVRQAKDFIHLVGDVKNRDAALP